MHGRRSNDLLYWIIAGLFLAGYAVRHIIAGLTFPVPWVDESHFLWQAIAFQRTNTLFTPELNPLRDILWMPPGYMVIVGIFFKIFGASLMVARSISFACMAASFVLLAIILRKRAYSYVMIILLGAMFLATPFVAAGNVARMDAMLLLIVSLSLLLFDYHREYAACALMAIAPLIHPNGFYFCFAVSGYMIFTKTRSNMRSLNYADYWFMVVVALTWFAYTFYIGNHWHDFISDMRFQFQRKGERRPFLIDFNGIVFLLFFFAVIIYGIYHKTISSLLAWFGIAMWFLCNVGSEIWYDFFYPISYVLIFAAVFPSIIFFSRSLNSAKMSRIPEIGIIALLLCIGGYAAIKTIYIQQSLLDVWTGKWADMKIERSSVSYITDKEINEIGDFLSSIGVSSSVNTHPFMVKFIPEADALFFTEKETPALHFCEGLFYQCPPDIIIGHHSRYLRDSSFPDTIDVIARQDSTDYFYFYKPSIAR